MFNRIFLLILDSVGIGEAKDALKYHDTGSNTIKHTLDISKIELPNLNKLGLLNLLNNSDEKVGAYYGIVEELSVGKDTLTGHLEMMGVHTTVPFKTFTETGFPNSLIKELEEKTGRKIIGNFSASGTEIIEQLGEEHMKTGAMIVYTSADSVLQIAAHEEIIPLEELYNICKIARELTLKDEYKVGRIIARPFIGTPGNFTRTPNRHDYALNPVHDTILDNLKNKGFDVISIGKIADIFDNCGITESNKIIDNMDGVDKLIEAIQKDFHGLCFINLNDFDSKYGHRRDVLGYAGALKEFDNRLPEILSNLRDNDLLIIMADHGNDPSFSGTDHTRENVPLFVYNTQFGSQKRISNLTTFADVGATIANNFKVNQTEIGTSFLEILK